MIARIIDWCSANALFVFLGVLGLAGWGLWAMSRIPLDAIPDISDVQVIVSTEWAGRSPDLIEDQITYPIVSSLLSTPRVKAVRGLNDFGVSYVYVIFEDGTDLYWARSRVQEYLQGIRGRLPGGVNPTIGPDATGVGWIYEYALVDEGRHRSLADLRGFQDWYLGHWLASVPGVAEVASIGGFTKQYQVNIDPHKLIARHIAINEVVTAIRSSNNDVDARLMESSGREYMVRGRGYLTSLSDLEKISIGTDERGSPIRVADVADVQIGPDIRRGVADLDGAGEVAGGIVVMRSGENALRVTEAVKAKLRALQPSLPPGVKIVPTYDRSSLISESIGTLRRTLLEEMFVVSLVIVVFLRHARSALIPALVLPIAVLASFVPMYYLGIPSNIMSLGGLALAIGVVVDASIVLVENAHRQIADSPLPAGRQTEVIAGAFKQIGRAIVFSLAIILVSFAPVFMLEGQEGRLFRPLAFTKTFAVAVASLLAVTFVPALMTRLIPGSRLVPESANSTSRALVRLYDPIIRAVLRRRWTALLLNLAIVPLAGLLLVHIGSEFMPPLQEGSFLYMPTAPPGLSVGSATRILRAQDAVLHSFPEVQHVFGTAGRASTSTDNSPVNMVNTIVTLKPRAEWRPGMTLGTLQAEMNAQLQFPGFPNVWTQPIRSRLDMLLTGIKTPVGIKVLGSDLGEIDRIGRQIERILQPLSGTRSVYAERTLQGYFTDIRLDREAIARFGLTIGDVEDVVESAIGGKNVTETIEGRERYPVNVRYERGFRSTLPDLEQVTVRSSRGVYVPLGQVANLSVTPGPAMVRDEHAQLAGYVYVDTATRDIGGYVARARKAVGAALALPPGYSLEWTGQYELQVHARERLEIVIPLVFAIIFALLCLTFRSVSESIIVLLSVVYAMTGGVILQWLLGYNFSVAVWVGYIALYGVAVQTGVVMVMFLHEALDARLRAGGEIVERDILEATIAGSVMRLRPKLMTATIVMAGLLPLFWSDGIGADLMKPIAAPIVGGMITSTIHVLVITPVIFYLVKTRALRRGRLRPSRVF